MKPSGAELERLYQLRFQGNELYRQKVWRLLVRDYFGRFVRPEDSVLDLGCGYGEFINQVSCAARFGMDLNPQSARHLGRNVEFLLQDCSETWALPDAKLDVVFTSNFFEHLPSKEALGKTLGQARRCLKPGGRVIAMGPNIKCVPGTYWDFWDHCLPLTELSLSEGLRSQGFEIEICLAKFLPHTMVNAPRYPLFLLRAYLALPLLWQVFGGQFLVVASR